MSVKITVFDGASTIGGSKIHLQGGDTGLFLDFGTNFKKCGFYFEEFLKPRSSRGLYDLLALGLIPPLEGVYRADLLPADLEIKSGIRPKVDAVFLSHAHMDHCGSVGLLDECIPVYCSTMTAVIIKAMQDSGQSNFESEVVYISPKAIAKNNPLAICTERGASCKGRQIYVIDDPEPARLENFWETTHSTKKLDPVFPSKANERAGSMNFKAFPSDHSIFGASCCAFETEVGWIVYTGDFRLHGMKGELSQAWVKELAKLKPRVLMIEGTNITEERKTSEGEVLANCLKEVKNASGKIVIADFSPRNIERLMTFLEIARVSNRKLVILAKDAFLLQAMRLADGSIPDVLDNPNLFIFDEIKSSPRLWERDFIRVKYEEKYVQPSEIQKSQADFILALSFWDVKHLLDIMPKGGIYIYSASEAFTEEQEFDIWRLNNWLDFFNIKPVGFKIASEAAQSGVCKPEFIQGYHSSGHVSGDELVDVIREIKPKTVIPVHTEHPELFIEKLGKEVEVILPEEGKPITIK